ncbi:DUF2238 domain-containing protein [Paenibacillus sp. CC-CFT747]|nr:DUF2238 domain-containing protein [Paenibacillus sp. CC-CFT747]
MPDESTPNPSINRSLEGETFPGTEVPLRRNGVVLVLLIGYSAFWAWLAIKPVNRQDWLLENILLLLFLAVMALTYRRFRWSRLSYVLIALFLCLHTVGAHYSYQQTPFDHWVKAMFSTQRSYYDRLVHFSFGFLLAYPARELLVRLLGLRGFTSYALPAAVMMTGSAVFEIIEMLAASLVPSKLGALYLGLQGDPFDTQKDMGLGLIGALLALAITAFRRRRKSE